jgi:hypothetical protein
MGNRDGVKKKGRKEGRERERERGPTHKPH